MKVKKLILKNCWQHYVETSQSKQRPNNHSKKVTLLLTRLCLLLDELSKVERSTMKTLRRVLVSLISWQKFLTQLKLPISPLLLETKSKQHIKTQKKLWRKESRTMFDWLLKRVWKLFLKIHWLLFSNPSPPIYSNLSPQLY